MAVVYNKLSVSDCARCGEVHADLEFRPFVKHPIDDYEYYAFCPYTGDPLLMKITAEGNSNGSR